MVYRLKDYYDIYTKSGLTRRKNLTKKQFIDVMKAFLFNLQEAIIEGKKIKLGYHLGTLQVARVPRNFSKPMPNWGESFKYRDKLIAEGKPLYNKETGEGNEWIIYFTDSYFYRYYWKKEKIASLGYRNKLHNIQVYKLKIYARTQSKLAGRIDELSPVVYETFSNALEK